MGSSAPAGRQDGREDVDGQDARAAARSLRARFRAEKLRATRRLGQHFLADLNLAGKIVDLLPPPAAGPVLEIGPGLGALTFLLVERGYRVLAVEIDPRLAAWLEEALTPWPEAWVRRADIRELDVTALAAGLMAESAGGCDRKPAGAAPAQKLQVIGNLPYYATSEILIQLLAHRRYLGDLVLTMQREVGARLSAPPGSRTYGSLSVALGLRASIESCLRLPATAFWPAPDVESMVVRLRWRETPGLPAGVSDRVFERIVRAAFAQRRKRLENSLATTLEIDRADATAAAEEACVPAGARAEALSPEDFVRLAAALLKRVPTLEQCGAEPESGSDRG